MRIIGASACASINRCWLTQSSRSTAALASTATPASTRLGNTRRWLDSIVIGQKLCPFAAPVRAEPQLKLRASSASTLEDIAAELAEEAVHLQKGIDNPEADTTKTTLLVLDTTIGDTALSWRELISLSWKLQAVLVEGEHSKHMQLVLFHPEATHNTYAEPGAPADAADYSIRAPYPVVQLLRECDILEAVEKYPDAAGIPVRNGTRLRAIGVEKCAATLKACFGSSQ